MNSVAVQMVCSISADKPGADRQPTSAERASEEGQVTLQISSLVGHRQRQYGRGVSRAQHSHLFDCVCM